MSAMFVSLIFAAGVGTWAFVKFQHSSGQDNNRSAIIGSALVALMAFIVLFSLFSIYAK